MEKDDKIRMDIVLFSTPVFKLDPPNPAIYQLKSILNEHGYSSRCFDMTQESYQHFGQLNRQIEKGLLDYYYNITSYDDIIKSYYNNFLKEKVLPLNPTWIGISVHSSQSYKSTSFLAKEIRKVLPSAKIIMGGYGFKDPFVDFNHYEVETPYDYHIKGDGEESLITLLKTNGNVIEEKQITNLDSLPYCDYSDYYDDFGDIEHIAIAGSKGCINNCYFCNERLYRKIYRQRSPYNIFNEIQHYRTEYNSRRFQFSENLMNGNMKNFRVFLQLLSNYCLDNPDISFSGYFAIRKGITKKDIIQMSKAHIRFPWIGIETASEKVRTSMGKNFTNKEMYFVLDNMFEQGLCCTILFIIGYPTETEEDFQENIKFLKHYASKRKQIRLRFGEGYFVYPGTKAETMGILKNINPKSRLFWKSSIVPNLDFPEIVRRRKLIGQVAKDLGYVFNMEEDSIEYLNQKLEVYNHG